MIRGIVSGFWNPLHFGHIEYINESKARCDELIVIVNNDYQVKLKGSKPFMDEGHRAKIVDNLASVNFVFISIDLDKTVCESIKYIKSLWPLDKFKFFNSGDRGGNNADTAEILLCKELDIEYVFIEKPKIYSSSVLLSQ